MENLAEWFPVFISQIDGKYRIVDIQPIVFVPDEAPMETVLCGIIFEGIELVSNLYIDVFVLSL